MKKIYLFALAAIILAACNPENKVPELTGISLNKDSIELEMDSIQQLVVNYQPEEAKDGAPEVVWESSDTNIAFVDGYGKVKGIKEGNATITATCGKFTATCEVSVIKEKPYLTLSESRIEVSQHGGMTTVKVKSNTYWYAETSVSWLHFSYENKDGDFYHSTYDDELKMSYRFKDVRIDWFASTTAEATTATIFFRYLNAKGEEVGHETLRVTREMATGRFFTIKEEGARKKVVFAPGNLRYCNNGSWGTWAFHDNQYDYIGDDNKNIGPTYMKYIDLFGWSTGDNPLLISNNDADYKSYFDDWAQNQIYNGAELMDKWTWFTLSYDEWTYLLTKRPNAANLFALAKINTGDTSLPNGGVVDGLILLPDLWRTPSGIAELHNDIEYSKTDWERMEQYGAVFLPCAGFRTYKKYGSEEQEVLGVGGHGYYWTSTQSSESIVDAQSLFFGPDNSPRMRTAEKHTGHSVRLVKEYVAE